VDNILMGDRVRKFGTERRKALGRGFGTPFRWVRLYVAHLLETTGDDAPQSPQDVG
jgi:hypothetical protein